MFWESQLFTDCVVTICGECVDATDDEEMKPNIYFFERKKWRQFWKSEAPVTKFSIFKIAPRILLNLNRTQG